MRNSQRWLPNDLIEIANSMDDILTTNPNLEQGQISVNTEDIFPIIKKSLYSDHEIFLRELIANAIDATQKLKYLSSMGTFQGELGELKISVAIDEEAKTITISDRGLGMTADEVKKYINQVAFSGAAEFLEKFKDIKEQNEIIGKFGLGFYSAFMVSEKVEIVSRSYQEGAEAVRWTCDGTTTYTLEATEKENRGTDVILHIEPDSVEFLQKARIQGILDKYCKFLPIEIEFDEKVVNATEPLWKKTPASLEDKDYKEFFKELYPMAEEPLFWIHLNVDYPFNLTGILFFPKIQKNIDPSRSNIQLYSRQVFITDEVKDIVPDYLMLLQGVIDSPDIPLNVSRSYLQSDSNVKKISSYITRKVAGKLKEIFFDDRKLYEEKWKDIALFVKYGMVTDDKFADRVKTFYLLQNTEGSFFTGEEYDEKIKETQTDKEGNLVYLYTTNPGEQDLFIRTAQAGGYDVLHMTDIIDSHFIYYLERNGEKKRWARVDSDTIDNLIPKEVDAEKEDDGQTVLTEEQETKLSAIFESAAEGQANLAFQPQTVGAEQLPVIIIRPEFMRRMKEMSETGGGGGMFGFNMGEQVKVVLNTDHALIQKVIEHEETSAKKLASQLLDLALLSQQMLKGEALTAFIHRSVNMLGQE